MEIVDVTFNFEQLEEIIVNKRKDCDEVCVQIADIMMLYDELDKIDPDLEMCMMERVALGQSLIEVTENLRKASKKLVDSINIYIAFMGARISYIENGKTEDQIMSDYKARNERLELRRKIKKYENLRVDHQEAIDGLISEIEREEDMGTELGE